MKAVAFIWKYIKKYKFQLYLNIINDKIYLKKFIYNIEQKRIAKYENYVIQRFRKVVLVSQKDISYFKAKGESNTSSLHCYKNGVDYEGIINKTYDPDKICFIGNMRTLQNQDAVLHYLNDIFPAVLEARPNTRLYIVGAEPSPTILKLASSPVMSSSLIAK